MPCATYCIGRAQDAIRVSRNPIKPSPSDKVSPAAIQSDHVCVRHRRKAGEEDAEKLTLQTFKMAIPMSNLPRRRFGESEGQPQFLPVCRARHSAVLVCALHGS